MIQCKIFSYIESRYGSSSADDKFNEFIKNNNISEDQIKDIKYTTTVGTNHDPVHNIFLLYDDTPTVMFDKELIGEIQQDLYKYISYTGTPS